MLKYGSESCGRKIVTHQAGPAGENCILKPVSHDKESPSSLYPETNAHDKESPGSLIIIGDSAAPPYLSKATHRCFLWGCSVVEPTIGLSLR